MHREKEMMDKSTRMELGGVADALESGEKYFLKSRGPQSETKFG
jgi:hypothetical protein